MFPMWGFCRDGVIISHKIIVASVSDFIKDIMRDIPSNDEVTIFLPDYHMDEVEIFLHLSESSKRFEDIFGGQRDNLIIRNDAYDKVKEEEYFESMKEEEDTDRYLKTEILDPYEEETSNKDPEDAENDKVKEGEYFESMKEEEDTDNYLKTEILDPDEEETSNKDPEDADKEGEMSSKEEVGSGKKTSKISTRNFCTKVVKATGQDNHLNHHNLLMKIALEKAKSYYLSGQSDSVRKAAKKFNVSHLTLNRKIALEKAKSYYSSGQSDSVKKAAKKFNVNYSSLYKLLKTGGMYEGKGTENSKYLTHDEEKNIVDRVRNLGENLDVKVF